MPAPIRLELDEAARAEVASRFDATGDAETRTRYRMVLLAADGRTAPEIAPLVRRSEDTVQRVLRRYQAGGSDAVPRRRPPGQAPHVPPAWRAELERVVERGPRAVGVPRVVWTPRLLAGEWDSAADRPAARAGDSV